MSRIGVACIQEPGIMCERCLSLTSSCLDLLQRGETMSQDPHSVLLDIPLVDDLVFVELALAYKCGDKLDDEKLVQYIHFNLHVNALRIDAMGNLVSSDKLQLLEISLDRRNT